MRTYHRVLVEPVVIIMPCPGARHLDRLEGWNAGGKCGPDHFLEQVPAGFEIGWISRLLALLGLRATGKIDRSLRPDIDAAGVHQQRHVLKAVARLENEHGALARLHWKVEAGHCRDLAGIRPGGV